MTSIVLFTTAFHVSVQCPAGPPASWVIVLVLGGLRAGYEVVVDVAKRWDR